MKYNLYNYYDPIIEFLDSLRSQYEGDCSIVTEKINKVEEKFNYEILDFNFKSIDNTRISFQISLSLCDFDSPRMIILVKKPDLDEYFEVFDIYLSKEDIVFSENLLKDIKSLLGNEFKVIYSFLNGKRIKENYIFFTIIDSEDKMINNLGYKKGVIFPWEKTKILERTYIYTPWL